MFIVKLLTVNDTFYLRGTILTSDETRAQKYKTREDARIAIDKAQKFQKATVNNALMISEVKPYGN